MSDQLLADADLAAIEARGMAATPGPWTVVECADTPHGPEYDIAELMGTAEDYAFVAHARADVPALLAEVRRLWVEVTKKQAVFTSVQRAYDQCQEAYAELLAVADRHVPIKDMPDSVDDWR